MAKYKVVHYLNQFFAGIGGEEKADHKPEIREEVIGPGMAIKSGLSDDFDIVATAICGDNYYGENLEEATDTLVEMIKKYEPDVFVAGPAFNAGRYGVACGTIAKAVEDAKKNLVRIPLNGTTLPHEQKGKFGGARVFLQPATEGTGVIAGGTVRAVLESVGIHNVLSKSQGSSNPHNVVKATFDALLQLRSAKTVAEQRGISLEKLFKG